MFLEASEKLANCKKVFLGLGNQIQISGLSSLKIYAAFSWKNSTLVPSLSFLILIIYGSRLAPSVGLFQSFCLFYDFFRALLCALPHDKCAWFTALAYKESSNLIVVVLPFKGGHGKEFRATLEKNFALFQTCLLFPAASRGLWQILGRFSRDFFQITLVSVCQAQQTFQAFRVRKMTIFFYNLPLSF